MSSFWHPDRVLFITREGAYHGMHVAGTSLAGIPANASGYGRLVDEVVRIAWDSTDELREAIALATPGRVAAFFCEPVVGAGGVFPPPEGYLEEARAICRDAGVLFVADEVITGFGRTGDWFASAREALEPDLVTCAKGLTSGYLPMGAVLVAPCRSNGILTRALVTGGLQISPALIVDDADIRELREGIGRALDGVGAAI